ncbi:MAG: hypothetical protein KDI69_08465 [Xanthomonadales bacterium]|nr:hypothetical protein [Xanthomonadales bacterium]
MAIKKNDDSSFDQDYEKLKAKNAAERALVDFKDWILAAPGDGIPDLDLIKLLRKKLPGLKIAVKKLVELRATWAAESDDKDSRQDPEPAGGQ